MDPGGQEVEEDGVAADFVLVQHGVHGAAHAAKPFAFGGAAEERPARRTAMYSKNESVPPDLSSFKSVCRMLSTVSAEKLFSGRPETIRS